jgi:hypothetical protein
MNIRKGLLLICVTLHSFHTFSSEAKSGEFTRPKKHELIVTNDTPFRLHLQSETSCMAEHFLPRETRKITPTSKEGSTFTFSLFNTTVMSQPSPISFATAYKHLTIKNDIHCFDIFIGKKPEEFLTQILFEDI